MANQRRQSTPSPPMVEKAQAVAKLTVNEFAAATNMKPATVRRWILERKIAHFKFGRSVRIPASELARICEQSFVPARMALQ